MYNELSNRNLKGTLTQKSKSNFKTSIKKTNIQKTKLKGNCTIGTKTELLNRNLKVTPTSKFKRTLQSQFKRNFNTEIENER